MVANFGPGVLSTPAEHGFDLLAWVLPIGGIAARRGRARRRRLVLVARARRAARRLRQAAARSRARAARRRRARALRWLRSSRSRSSPGCSPWSRRACCRSSPATSRRSRRSRSTGSASAASRAAWSPRASRSSLGFTRRLRRCSARRRRRSAAPSTSARRSRSPASCCRARARVPRRAAVARAGGRARASCSARAAAARSALLGGAFAVCAAPCIGTVLASILVLASSTRDDRPRRRPARRLLARARRRRSSLAGVAFAHAMRAFRWVRDHYAIVRVAVRRDPRRARAAALLQPRLVAARRARPGVHEDRARHALAPRAARATSSPRCDGAYGGEPPQRLHALALGCDRPSAAALVRRDDDVHEPWKKSRSSAVARAPRRLERLVRLEERSGAGEREPSLVGRRDDAMFVIRHGDDPVVWGRSVHPREARGAPSRASLRDLGRGRPTRSRDRRHRADRRRRRRRHASPTCRSSATRTTPTPPGCGARTPPASTRWSRNPRSSSARGS